MNSTTRAGPPSEAESPRVQARRQVETRLRQSIFPKLTPWGRAMNRLLSFNPEPFETESEIEVASRTRKFGRSGFCEQCGCQHAAGRGCSPYLRGLPAASRAQDWSAFESDREISPFGQALRRTPRRSAPAVSLSPRPSFEAQAFRRKAVRIAKQELMRWGSGRIKESDPALRKTLQDYWKTGAGVTYREDQLGNPAFQSEHPWSAAFISWVMKTAGAGDAFKYSASHSVYTRAAKDNRIANNSNPFKAYRIAELAPQVGDLICKSRAGSGATYDNIRPGMTTHCDIVTEVRPGSIAAVGGNVSNSVAQSNVRTDSGGRIIAPNYFAVIRVDNQQPSTPVVPVPTPPQPSAASPPRLLKQESTPPGVTLYAEIDLKIVDKAGIRAPSVTGIFIPDGYQQGATVDVVLYLHGFKAEAIKREAIDQYWNSQRFPYGALREGVNASARNVVLVAPTLGSRSEAGSLLKQGGLDAYIGQVLATLAAHGSQSRAATAPRLGNLIFACHSGGGWPMRQIAGGSDRALARVRECWGFDCTYNGGDDAFWAKWARARPNARVFIYYVSGSKTAPLAQSLRNMRVPNAIVQTSRDRRHNYVPITHWQERLEGASFLGARRGPRPQPTKLAWGARVSPEFRRRVREICAGLGCDPNHLMAAMAFESAETFSPSVRNRLSGATGLIQFMPSTAQRLGTTTDALAAMTPEKQLDYVSRYFSPYSGRLGTIEDVYMVILWPKAVGASNDTALFAKPSTAYEQNKALDVNGDGVVSKFEAAQFVRAKLTKGLGAGYVG